MKFRIKYRNVSRAALVEEDGTNAKLSRLHEVVSITFSDLLPGSFYLSLNKKDSLGDGDQTLGDLGLVSGDLLYIVSADPDTEQVDQQQQPTAQPGNKSLGLPNTKTVGPNTSEQPSTSQQYQKPRDFGRQQPSYSREDEMEAESIHSEAVNPVDLAVVSHCLNEPRLCSESTVGRMPALLSELYSDTHCRFPEEALCLVLHVLMIEAGYQPTVSNKTSNQTDTESDRDMTDRLDCPSEPGVCPHSAWRRQAPAFYCLEYTHPSSGPAVYTVTAVPMGASLVVHGQLKIEEKIEKCKCQLKTSDYVGELTPEATTCYQNLPKLSRVFKDCVCLPLLQKYREAMNLVPLHGIQALSSELKLKILGQLDVVSLLKMSQVCKEFHRLGMDRFIWRRLFLWYFGNRAQNDLNQNWRELYKSEYRQRKQHRKWLGRMTGSLHPFIPADPYTQRVPPPLAPFRQGVIGGDYDLYPQFHGVPNPLFGGRTGAIPDMRPRFDPFGPDQNFFPGPGGGMRDRQGGGSRFLSGSRSGNAWLGGGPRMF